MTRLAGLARLVIVVTALSSGYLASAPRSQSQPDQPPRSAISAVLGTFPQGSDSGERERNTAGVASGAPTRGARSAGIAVPEPSKGHTVPTATGNGQSARYSPSSPKPAARVTGAPLIALGQGALTTGHASMCDNSGVGVSDENPYHG